MTAEHETQVNEARHQQTERLRDRERSWLALAGLFPLSDGINTIGSDPSNRIILANVARNAGTLNVSHLGIRIYAGQGSGMMIDGKPITQAELKVDRSGDPTYVEIGSLIFVVIERGERPYLRVWDKNHPARKNFHGLNFYPIDPAYCITAKFVQYENAKPIEIEDIIGTRSMIDHLGYAEFEWQGQTCRLEAIGDDEGLFFNFKDLTNGETTYPSGRFLDAPAPKDGQVILDFNLATNPPCAYTDYATCPLPPPQNKLNVRIEAGEKKYHE
jgi:hypothetical protein